MSDRPDSDRARIADAVRVFYAELPFNFHGSVESSVAAVLADPVRATYPDLHTLLVSGRVRRALELGCGAGWLANTLARHHGVEVTAVDFAPNALERARAVATQLGTTLRLQFVEADLFGFDDRREYDLVLSLGVLHHTGDTERALRHTASFVAPGGHLYVGLYHAPARRVFLDALQGVAARAGEEAAFELFKALDHAHRHDETLLRSWFRDQVLHPHETQHTLREVVPWLDAAGLTLTSTSINRFGPVDDLAALFDLEETYSERARRALDVERRYFPGFFTALARRT
jgi:SAM-dependent methyltransferase